MKVNQNIFNRARLEAAKELDRIVRYLNAKKIDPVTIRIENPKDLRNMFNNLRHWIVVLACLYDADDPKKISDLSEKIPQIPDLFPEEEEE